MSGTPNEFFALLKRVYNLYPHWFSGSWPFHSDIPEEVQRQSPFVGFDLWRNEYVSGEVFRDHWVRGLPRKYSGCPNGYEWPLVQENIFYLNVLAANKLHWNGRASRAPLLNIGEGGVIGGRPPRGRVTGWNDDNGCTSISTVPSRGEIFLSKNSTVNFLAKLSCFRSPFCGLSGISTLSCHKCLVGVVYFCDMLAGYHAISEVRCWFPTSFPSIRTTSPAMEVAPRIRRGLLHVRSSSPPRTVRADILLLG